MDVYHQRSLEVVVKILTPFNSLLAGAKEVVPGGWERLPVLGGLADKSAIDREMPPALCGSEDGRNCSVVYSRMSTGR